MDLPMRSQRYQRIPVAGPLGAFRRRGHGAYGAGMIEEGNAILAEDQSPLRAFFSLRFYQSLVVEAFAGIVSAVSVYYVMRYLESRGKRKKNGRGRKRRRR